MPPRVLALLAATLVGTQAQHDQPEQMLVESLVDDLFDGSYPSRDGLDDTTLARSALMSSRFRMPSARVPALSREPRFMINGMPGVASPVQGNEPQSDQNCFRAVVTSATVATKTGYKVVDGRDVPFNLFKKANALKVKVVKNDKHPHTLTENTGDANWETTHVTFDHGGEYPYLEGMSLGLISPGPDKKGQTPAAIRLYSIASSAVGDDQTSKTVSLCVKRVVELDGKFANREKGEDKPDKAGTQFKDNKVYRGVASNFICDLKEGDEVMITGPVGTEMLLPQDNEANIIMLATGTGIAPMRSYQRLLFEDAAGANPDGSRKFKGLAWLFLGVPFSKSILYDDENRAYKEKFPSQFRYDYAVSREQKNAAGQKMYIQTRIAEYAQEVWDLMQQPKTHLYICGLKGMEKGIAEVLGPIAESQGLEWPVLVKEWKKAGRWHVEVY
jgi:ferredoxin--NADP+ reductase